MDLDQNELVLVYKARGMSQAAAEHRAAERLGQFTCDCDPSLSLHPERSNEQDEHEAIGSAWQAAVSSFCFFASGAVVPILPFIFGMVGIPALAVAAVLVGLVLLGTGAIVGLLAGASPLWRATRQLLIGFGAAAVTYVLGWIFGAAVG